jgi:hypothetical protein
VIATTIKRIKIEKQANIKAATVIEIPWTTSKSR